MRVIKQSAIAGTSVTVLRQITDDRGAVLHMLRSDSPDYTGFGECYFSEVLPGVVKAWKKHSLQTQNLCVPVGRLRMVMYDGRGGSVSHGHLQVLELGRPDAYLRLCIPPGVWYGFGCMGATAALLANCVDLPHDPAESETCMPGDPMIPFSWQEWQA